MNGGTPKKIEKVLDIPVLLLHIKSHSWTKYGVMKACNYNSYRRKNIAGVASTFRRH